MQAGALSLCVGPFNVALQSSLRHVSDLVTLFYRDVPLAPIDVYRDYRLAVTHPRTVRRWVRPYAIFDGDGDRPFEPLPDDLAYPMLEWGFNWQVATNAHQYLMLHAAVIERGGLTVLMPALPGSGKSTLAAALMHSGWRLLSDEFGLVRPGTTSFIPFPRPIPLKNESIAVLENFAPAAVVGPVFHGTRKGNIAHCRPTEDSVLRGQEPAQVTHIVFPEFETGARVSPRQFDKAKAFMKVCGNSFNYEVLGQRGFDTVGDIIEKSECLSFIYGDLHEAIAWFDGLKRPH